MKIFIPILTLSAILSPLAQAQDRERPLRPARPEANERSEPKTDKIDWESIKKRIEGAVERGDMTRDQANQKYLEIKKNMANRNAEQNRRPTPQQRPESPRPMAGPDRPSALAQVLGDLVAQNKITREDARRIVQAAHGAPSPVPNRTWRGEAPMPQNREMTEELRKVLNAAKEELAAIREAKEQILKHQHERSQIEMEKSRIEAHRRELELNEQRKNLEERRKKIQELERE